MERRWGSDLTVFVAPPTVAGAVPWWLLLLPKVQHGVESTGARTACKPAVRSRASHWAASACRHSSESLSKIHSRPVLLRRTVLKPQLLLFVTCMGEANALRKSRWKGELLLVKAQLRVFHGTVAGERSDEVQLVQVEAVLVVGVPTACSAVVIS